MNKKNIIKILTYLNHCYPGKFKFPKQSKIENEMLIEVWHDLLKFYDEKLVISILKKLIINNGHWPPSVGEIVKDIERFKLPADEKITAGEAWSMVLSSVRKFGYYKAGEAMNSLPPKVKEAVEHFGGFTAICHSKCDNNYVRSQFIKLYQEVNRHNEELLYLPAAVRNELLEASPQNNDPKGECLL